MKRFYFIGFFFSIIFYSTILFVLSFYFSNSSYFVEKFTNKKNNFLDIILVERQSSQNDATNNINDKKGSKTTKQNEAKSLFSSINTDNLSKKITKEVSVKLPPSRLLGNSTDKSTKATDIFKKLEYKQHSLSIKSSDSSGKYDEYIGEISNILDESWQKTLYISSEFKSVVKIWIDKNGVFSFSIESLSYNNAFNEKVKFFLEEMKLKSFPPYKGNGKIELRVVFKDDKVEM